MNNQDNFIKSINFQEDYLPFKKDFEMYLSGWEKETQELIKYYLEKTWNKNYKKNSERFKINVILANNWGGKSRLLEAIKSDSIDLISLIWEEEKKSIFKWLNLKQYNVILDNLSPMSDNNYLSVNQNLLHWKWYWNFYLSLFNFLNNKEDWKEKYKLIEEYFNADLSADDWFILTINYSNKWVFSEIKEKIKNKYKWDEITNGEFDKFIDNLFYYEWFWWTITFYENTTPNLKELLRNANSQDDIFFYIYLITTWYLKELIDDRWEMWYADWATGIFDELWKEDEQLTFNNLINKKCGIKHKKWNKFSDNEIKKILKVVYEKVYKDNEWKFINIKTFNKDWKAEFADDEIKFFAKNFDINIKFKLKI